MRNEPQTLKHVEIIHTSLTGLALICVVLLIGLLLPVFGFNPLHSPFVALLVVIVVVVGIGYLYFLNYNAHKIVQAQARLTDVLINSLGQGFLTFNAKGICGSVYSQACYALLNTEDIANRNITDVLALPEDKRPDFIDWLAILFQNDHALSFEDAARFLPDCITGQEERHVLLSYRPIMGRDGKLQRIVMIATDHTEERDAQKRADHERQFAGMICAIFAERRNFMLTMAEIREMLKKLSDAGDAILEPDFFRMVHTMKGAAMHFKMEKLGDAMHNLEEVLRVARELSIDEGKEKIAEARGLVQIEYGRVQNVLRDVVGEEEEFNQGLIEVDEEAVYHFGRLLKQQNVSPDIIYAYQSSVLSVPIFTMLKTLDRQIQPLAAKLEKRVKAIAFHGEIIRLPVRPLQYLVMALTHVVHNILDHGIEAPLARMAKGKDPQGQVRVEARRFTDDYGAKWIEIAIADDGAGIDPNRVRAKLMEADPEGAWRFDNDQEIVQQLLTHNVSTRDEVSLLSGRGEGMGAIYQEVVRLGGRCQLESEMHVGTKLTLYLPEKLEGSFE